MTINHELEKAAAEYYSRMMQKRKDAKEFM